MTNNVQSCLSQEMLVRIGDNEVSPAELSSIEEHVSDCARCREEFDSVYAAQQWREDIRPALLEPLQLDQLPADDDATDQEEILNLLGPTDDPHMLGRIGSYEIAGIIGRGGMGVVFKAFDAALDRFVAIKILSPQLASSGAARKRFMREGKAAAAVVDDHVLPVYGVDQWRAIPYLVMQYSRGVSLQQRLSDQGPQELNDILRIGSQIAHGLSAAHAQGLVHRDVKPSNMLLDATVERVMLTDFGLARAIDDASVTRTGTIAGTPQYMSPEQVRGEAIDARSDLFGLGCVIYAMCTGHSPFRSESSYAVLRRITDDTPRPIRETNPDIPAWLEQIVMKLLAKSPDDRFESAEQVAELLRGCLAHVQQPTNTPLPESVAALAPRQNRRPPIGKLVATAAFAFSLIFAGVLIVLELNKGTLKIESDVDDITIRILQGDEEVDELTITQSGDSLRVAAGKYVVAIAGESDGLTVENGRVTLQRRGIEVVRIVRSKKPVDMSTALPTPQDRTDSVNEDAIRDGGKIVVDIYCGDDVLSQMNTNGANKDRHVKLLQALNALPDVVTNFRVAGQGNDIFKAIARVPKGIEKQREVLTAIKSAMKSASVARFQVQYLAGAIVLPGDVVHTLGDGETLGAIGSDAVESDTAAVMQNQSEMIQIFAPVDGQVVQVHVDHDDQVYKGNLLVTLINREIAAEVRKLQREIDASNEQIASVNDLTDPADLEGLRRSRQKLQAQLNVVRKKQHQLELRSPVNGVVLDRKLKERLQGRRVTSGQVLLTIANNLSKSQTNPSAVESNGHQGNGTETDASSSQLQEKKSDAEEPVAVVMLMHPAELRNGNTVQRAAATRVIGSLAANDYCGILHYGKSGSTWLWGDGDELQQIGDHREQRLADIAVSHSGDTPLFDPALRMSFAALKHVAASQKQLIIFTDGDPSFLDETLIEQYRDSGIRVSVIHVDIHRIKAVPALKLLTQQTGGDYHYVLDSQAGAIELLFQREIQALRTDRFAALRKIGLAFHTLHDKFGKFPGSACNHVDGDGREFDHPFSWRVAILPYVGQQDLFNEYRFDEPWDSDRNLRLLNRMPNIYRSPHATSDQPVGNANMLGFATESGALGMSGGEAISSITDGTSNTILIVESAASVPWTKPADLTKPNTQPFPNQPLRFVRADGSVGAMNPIDAAELKKMITRNGGEILGKRKVSAVSNQPPLPNQQPKIDVATPMPNTGHNNRPTPKPVADNSEDEKTTGRIEGHVFPLQPPRISMEAMKAMAESVKAMSEEQKAKLPEFLRKPLIVPKQLPATDFQFVKSIKLYAGNSPNVKAEVEVSKDGNFVFEDVPAGPIRLSPQLQGAGKFAVTLTALNVPSVVRAGETTKVTYFGEGVPVIGKVVLPRGVKPETARIGLYLEAPPMRSLGGRNGRPSPTSSAYFLVKSRKLESVVDAEGNFRIEGVREGNYRLMMSVVDDNKSFQLAFKEVVAGYPYVHYGKMTIPLMKDGKSDKPVNIGTLKFVRRAE